MFDGSPTGFAGVSPWLRTRLIQPNFLTGKAHRTYIHAEQQYSR